jgi:hypothetical protein
MAKGPILKTKLGDRDLNPKYVIYINKLRGLRLEMDLGLNVNVYFYWLASSV